MSKKWSITDIPIPSVNMRVIKMKWNRIPRKKKKKMKKWIKWFNKTDFTYSVDYCYNPDLINPKQ